MIRKILLPVIFGFLVFGFWISPDFQEISAGVAIFLFGMLMLEDGFRLFSGGLLERILERATDRVWKAIGFGMVTTTLMQSSSLVSVITISFLSAGLLPLLAGVGIIFGANIGTTTGAWLVAGFGLKVKISAYAMPMLVFGVILVFQSSKYLKGIGYVIAGLGFLFLGIHHMKEGFEAFRDQVDLTQLALGGFLGLTVYCLVGALATVIMQSSHATMVLIITALAAAQITYENALALAIGANIGTTITAIIGALTANYQGRRLAAAHLVFNTVTAAVAILLIAQLRLAVEGVSDFVGIAPGDYALKLAVFQSIFNLLGVLLMTPAIGRLIALLERAIPAPVQDISQPRYLNAAVTAFPVTVVKALRDEVAHLYDNAVEIIAHGLNLHRSAIFGSEDLKQAVGASRKVIEFDLDRRYEDRVKALYAAIVDFTTQAAQDLPEEAAERVYRLREVSGKIVEAVKAVKHLRKNIGKFTVQPQGVAGELYNEMRLQLAEILREIETYERAEQSERTALWLDETRVEVERNYKQASRRIDSLIREKKLRAEQATSFLNDSGYAYNAMRNLIDVARELYIERIPALAEVERILSLEDEEVTELLDEVGDGGGSDAEAAGMGRGHEA